MPCKPDIRWCLRSREHRVTTVVWGHIMCRMICSTCAHKLKTKINHPNAQLRFPTRNSGYPGDWQIYSADQGFIWPPVSSPSEVAMLLMFWLLIQHSGDTSLNTLGTERAKYQADHGGRGGLFKWPQQVWMLGHNFIPPPRLSLHASVSCSQLCLVLCLCLF